MSASTRIKVITKQDIARNPVAKAVARARTKDRLLTLRLKLYMATAGELLPGELEETAMVLALLGYAAELDPAIGPQSPQVRVVRGGLSACQQMLPVGKWDPAQAAALDSALTAAEELNTRVKAEYMLDAWEQLTKVPTCPQTNG